MIEIELFILRYVLVHYSVVVKEGGMREGRNGGSGAKDGRGGRMKHAYEDRGDATSDNEEEQQLKGTCAEALKKLAALQVSLSENGGSMGILSANADIRSNPSGRSNTAAVSVRGIPGGFTENAVVACIQGLQNVTLAKLLGSLAHLTRAVEELEERALNEAYPLLVMTGEAPTHEDPYEEGVAQLRLAAGIGDLLQASAIADDAAEIAVNCVAQLAALSSDEQRTYGTFKRESVNLLSVLYAIGGALCIVGKMDSIIEANPGVSRTLSLFRSMLDVMEDDQAAFNVNENEIEELHVALDKVESRFASNTPLLLRILQDKLSSGSNFEVTKTFLRSLRNGIGKMLTTVTSRIGSSEERLDDRDSFLKLSILVIAYYWIAAGETADLKLAKVLFDSFKNIPIVCAYSEIGISMPHLLQSHLPSWAAVMLPKDSDKLSSSFFEEYLHQIDGRFVNEIDQLKISIDCWILSLEGLVSGRAALQENYFSDILTLLIQGIYMACRTRTLILDMNMMHLKMEKPLNIILVRSLGRGLEMLKALEICFNKISIRLVEGVLLQVSRQIQGMMFNILNPVRIELEAKLSGASVNTKSSRKKMEMSADDDAALDAFAAATLMLNLLQGPPSAMRMHVANIICDLLRDTHFFNEEDSAQLSAKKYLLYIVTHIQDLVKRQCDTTFVYFSRDLLLPTLLSEIFSNTERSSRLRYLLSAFRNAELLLSKAPGGGSDLLKSFTSELDKQIDNCILKPLCENVETDLRLHLHSAKLDGAVMSNPTRTGVRAISKILALPTLKLRSGLLNIKWYVTQYLNETFYNLTSLALHNWKTYGEMAELSRQKYGIILEKMQLPNQQLEQGLDVLEVMRNIHIFSAKFNYNLNMQVFVEKASQSQQRKHLNTVSIRHITNSIRTHGMGITDTTVKFVYQYLSKKFIIFSQFLYDDHIKSRLRRELKMFHSLKREMRVAAEYPFPSAENFKKDIRKLGLTDDGGSYLDQFRKLITEIGNALGFIRLVRLAAASFSHGAVRFMSIGANLRGNGRSEVSHQAVSAHEKSSLKRVSTADIQVTENGSEHSPENDTGGSSSFESLAKSENFDDDTISIGRLLDEVQERMQNSLDRAEYFRILVEVFSKGLNQEKNTHLKDFYILIPALCSSHVDALLLAKEKLTKRGKDSVQAAISDDGFAVGISYILKVLHQDAAFDALRWFDAVRKHFTAEGTRLNSQSLSPTRSLAAKYDMPLDPNSRGISSYVSPNGQNQQRMLSEEEIQNIQLLKTRAKSQATEFELLEFCISSSRTFFV